MADFTRLRGRHLRVEPHGLHRLEAGHREARRRREEDEVVRLERDGALAVHGETTASLQHGAEAGVAEGRIGDGPTTGAAEEGLIPEAYVPFAQRILASLAEGPARVTTETDVAEAVWRAANDVTGQLRFPAGADAVALARSS